MHVQRYVPLIVLTAMSFVGCAVRDSGPRTAAEFLVQHGTPPFVDLSDRVRDCPRRYRRTLENGTLEFCHSRSLPTSVIAQVADDYEAFFDLAESTFGRGEHVTLQASLLEFDELPDSYRFEVRRHGEAWRTRWVTVLLLTRESPRGSDAYWRQVGPDIHEMTHAFMGDGLFACSERKSALRWLQDGIADLMQERYLRLRAPESHEGWLARRDLGIRSHPLDSFDRLLDWESFDLDELSLDAAGLEFSHYVASHRLVKHLFEIRDGEPLRAFVELVDSRGEWSPETIKAALFESFPELTLEQLAEFVN